jgi:hypothetical protein
MLEPLSRRTLLRGLGTAIALPWLEAMLPPRCSTPIAPPRLVFVYAPNGVHMSQWTPTSVGSEFEMTPTLAPLAAHRSNLLVLSDLTHDKARPNGDGPGDHARASATFLTACQAVKTDGTGIRVAISVDQYAARVLGNSTRLRSLELGCEAGKLAGQCDSGYSCAYSNSISWSTPHTPMAKEVDPRLAFDRLFGDGDSESSEAEREARRVRRASLLDVVRADAARLASRLGSADRAKLDEYLTGVRELERRIDLSAQTASDAVLAAQRPRALPADYGEHVRMMCDLIALALRADTTRVATLMLANEGSNKSYASLGAPEGHHELSHHRKDGAKETKIAAINRHHVALFVRLIDQLAEPEADSVLLDSTLVVYGSGMSDGDRHNHDDLPILVVGGRQLGVCGGRHVRYAPGTPCANLWLTLLDRVGVGMPALGDSTGQLDLG